jgi:hypothetical protein
MQTCLLFNDPITFCRPPLAVDYMCRQFLISIKNIQLENYNYCWQLSSQKHNVNEQMHFEKIPVSSAIRVQFIVYIFFHVVLISISWRLFASAINYSVD